MKQCDTVLYNFVSTNARLIEKARTLT